jgi:hypothetical protein
LLGTAVDHGECENYRPAEAHEMATDFLRAGPPVTGAGRRFGTRHVDDAFYGIAEAVAEGIATGAGGGTNMAGWALEEVESCADPIAFAVK